MDLEELKTELEKLNDKDFDRLIQFIKDHKLINQYTTILVDALEKKYSNSFVCSICGSVHVVRNGHYKNGTQKYLCKECHKTFSLYRDTILENTKLHPVTCLKYLIIMNEDEDLRDCAQYAGCYTENFPHQFLNTKRKLKYTKRYENCRYRLHFSYLLCLIRFII